MNLLRRVLQACLIFQSAFFGYAFGHTSEKAIHSECKRADILNRNQQFNFHIPSHLNTVADESMTIEKIDIIIFNVFNLDDPEEDRWYARWANRLHIKTRESVIRAQLLLKEGDAWSASLAEESERLLRANDYLFDARLRVAEICGDKIKLQVIVRDVWTLTGGVSASRSGGENTYRSSITDRNFLGLGVALALSKSRDSERSSEEIALKIPNLFDTRWQSLLAYHNQDDGQGHRIELERPFYSLATPFALAFSSAEDTRTDSIYFRNQVIEQFQHQQSREQIWGGIATHLSQDSVNRWLLGVSKESHRFSPVLTATQSLPADRTRNHLWLSWQWQQDRYQKARSFNRIGQTEDIDVGRFASLSVGYGSESFDNDESFWRFDARYRTSFIAQERRLGFLDFQASGDHLNQHSHWQNLKTQVDLRWYIEPFSASQWYFALAVRRASNLTFDQQLLLGGDNGLRGYPARYQEGDRSFVASAEKRYFFNWQLAKMLHFGFAIFADVGRAWFADRDNGINGKTLSDVGFGLRISSNRFDLDKVLHVDVAFPLQREDPSIDRVQLLVRGKSRF